MRNLLITLSSFFVLVFGTLALDKLCNGTLTGRGLVGSLAIAIILTWWHIYRQRQRIKEQDRQEALRRRAVAEMVVTSYRRALNQRGEAEGDLTNWLVVVAVVAILFFMVTGYCKGGASATTWTRR